MIFNRILGGLLILFLTVSLRLNASEIDAPITLRSHSEIETLIQDMRQRLTPEEFTAFVQAITYLGSSTREIYDPESKAERDILLASLVHGRSARQVIVLGNFIGAQQMEFAALDEGGSAAAVLDAAAKERRKFALAKSEVAKKIVRQYLQK